MVGGGHVGIHQVVLHARRVLRSRIVVEKLLKHVDRAVEWGSPTLTLTHGVVIEGHFLDTRVVVHIGGLFKGYGGGVHIALLHAALPQVEVSALREGVVHTEYAAHALDGGSEIAFAEVYYTQCVGGCA